MGRPRTGTLHRGRDGHSVARSPLNEGTANHLVFNATSPVSGIPFGAKRLDVSGQPDLRMSAFHVEEGVFIIVAIGLGTVRTPHCTEIVPEQNVRCSLVDAIGEAGNLAT